MVHGIHGAYPLGWDPPEHLVDEVGGNLDLFVPVPILFEDLGQVEFGDHLRLLK